MSKLNLTDNERSKVVVDFNVNKFEAEANGIFIGSYYDVTALRAELTENEIYNFNMTPIASRKYMEQLAETVKAGQQVICNGYPGTITKVCDGQLIGMVEVRVPGGVVCVGISSLGK